MGHKTKIAAACLAAMLLFILTGCQPTQAPEQKAEETNAPEDRLAGVLITTRHLDMSELAQGRLYATLTAKTEEYVFKGVDGIYFYSVRVPATAQRESFTTSEADEAVSDRRMDLESEADGSGSTTSDSVSMEGTIYMVPGRIEMLYFNSVYQSADGRIYAIPGPGTPFGDFDEGSAFSRAFDDSSVITENGKKITVNISFKLNVSPMYPPDKIVILQLDQDSSVVSRMEYAPDKVPETATPKKGTEYFIVETRRNNDSGKAQISRKLYGKDADFLEAFYGRDDGICVQQEVFISWPE